MSYINDALKKAQSERKGHYLSHMPLVTEDDRSKRRFRRRAAVIGLSVLAVFMVCAVVIWGLPNWDSAPSVQKTVQREIAAVKADTVSPAPPAQEKSATVVVSPVEASKPDNDKSMAAMPDENRPEVIKKTEVIKKKDVSKTKKEKLQDQQDLLVLYQDALMQQQQHQFAAAEKIYLRILRRDTKHIYALNNLGVIYLSQKRLTKAKEMFLKAIQGDKNYVDPFYNMACLYAQVRNQEKSLLYLKKAVKISGDVRRWVKEDKDFENLRNNEEFNLLMEERK